MNAWLVLLAAYAVWVALACVALRGARRHYRELAE